MRHSSDIDQIAAALATALPAIVPPKRTKTGRTSTGEEYLYAELADDLNAAKRPLAKVGIVIMQESIATSAAVVTTTRLQHNSGQYFETEPLELPLLCNMSAPEIGALITYGRRYQLEGVLGMSAQHDSDAASAAVPPSGRGISTAPASPGSTAPAAPRPAPPHQRKGAAGADAGDRKPSGTQRSMITARFKKLGLEGAALDDFMRAAIGKAPATYEQASALITALDAEIARGGGE